MEYCKMTKIDMVRKWILEWFINWVWSMLFTILIQLVMFMREYRNRAVAAAVIQWLYVQVCIALMDILRPFTWPVSVVGSQLGFNPYGSLTRREDFLLGRIKRELANSDPRYRAAFQRLQVRNPCMFGWKRDYAQAVSIRNVHGHYFVLHDLYNRAFCSPYYTRHIKGIPVLSSSIGMDEMVARLDRYDEFMISIGIRVLADRVACTGELHNLLARGRIMLRDEMKWPVVHWHFNGRHYSA